MSHITAIVRMLVQTPQSVWKLKDDTLSYEHTGRSLTLADPWQIREGFLRLRNNTELVLFLTAVGSFFDGPDSRVVQHYWAWQEVLRKMIVKGPSVLDQEFTKRSPILPTILRRRAEVVFAKTVFKQEDGAVVLELTVAGTLPALIQTIRIDHLRGVKFRTCARKDCETPFPVLSKHRKKYCTWHCAHLESVRRSRKRAKKETKRR